MEERAPAPRLGCRPLAGRLVLRNWLFQLLVSIPGKGTALIDGVERVDDGDATRDRQAGFAAAPAEVVEQGDFIVAGKAAIDDPVDDAIDVFCLHCHPDSVQPARSGQRVGGLDCRIELGGVAALLTRAVTGALA